MHTDEESEVEALVSSAAQAAEKDTEAMAGDEGMAEARYFEMEKRRCPTCAARRPPSCIIPAQ